MTKGGAAVAVDKLVDSPPAESIDQLRLRSRGPVDVETPAALAGQHTLFMKAAHHRHDCGVGALALLASTQGPNDIPDARLTALGDYPNDCGGKRPENVFEAWVLRHGVPLIGQFRDATCGHCCREALHASLLPRGWRFGRPR